jgi:hypothetical protein
LTGAEFLGTVQATVAQDLGEPSHDVVGDRRVEAGERPSAGLPGTSADPDVSLGPPNQSPYNRRKK